MKKQQLGKWLLTLALLFAGSFVHAEGGCPPGMIPYSGTDISSCGPIPDYNQPQGHWQDQWGANALGDDGTSGWSSNQPNEDIAKESAIKNCVSKGGSKCEIELTYKNSCIAVVNGEKTSYSSSDTTTRKAIKRAKNLCKKEGDNDCQVFRTECSPAKWVGN